MRAACARHTSGLHGLEPSQSQSLREVTPVLPSLPELFARRGTTAPSPSAQAESSSDSARPSDWRPPEILRDHSKYSNYILASTGAFLGKGGFATVWKYRLEGTHQEYAIKIFDSNYCNASRKNNEKFWREFQIHRSCRHENIVAYHGMFQDPENIYMLLEYCPNSTLLDAISSARDGRLSPEVSFVYLQGIVSAVQYLHDREILHRDLKPGNVLLSGSTAKLCDFGLAINFSQVSCKVSGTPNYLAPEILTGEGHSTASEAWALGCMLYCMLTGRPPFETENISSTYARIKKGRYRWPSFPLEHRAVTLVDRLLVVDVGNRMTVRAIPTSAFFVYFNAEARNKADLYCSSIASVDDNANAFSSMCLEESATAGGCSELITSPYSQRRPQQSQQSQMLYRRADPYSGIAYADEEDHVMVRSAPSMTARVTAPVVSPALMRKARSPSIVRTGELRVEPYQYQSHNTRPLSSHDSGMGSEPHLLSPRSDLGAVFDFFVAQLDLLIAKRLVLVERPNSAAFFVSKWVDYSNKFGFGCILSDDSITIRFVDQAVVAVSADGEVVKYGDGCSSPRIYSSALLPPVVEGAVRITESYRGYMDRELAGAVNVNGFMPPSPVADDSGRRELCYLAYESKTSDRVLMLLSDGTLQVNLSSPHVKLVLSVVAPNSLRGSSAARLRLSIIDTSKQIRTFDTMPCNPEYSNLDSDTLSVLCTVVEQLCTERSRLGASPPPPAQLAGDGAQSVVQSSSDRLGTVATAC